MVSAINFNSKRSMHPARTALKRAEARAPRSGVRRRAFTLLEVMIAVGVLFMCLFAVLALLSNSLATARKLQQHRDIDLSTVAGKAYVLLINTNRGGEGPFDMDLEDIYPGAKFEGDRQRAGSNGLFQVHFDVSRNQKIEVSGDFYIYRPDWQVGGPAQSHL